MSRHSTSCLLSHRQLLGMDDSHLVSAAFGPGGGEVCLHADAAAAFAAMRQAALEQGIGLCVASGFRSFDRQLAIWNAKASGQRPCLDDQGNALQLEAMTPWQAVQSILRFSALPGTSRHHWGTDMDLYDERAVPADYRLQLVAGEYGEQGPFYPMHRWLLQHARAYGFFHPYAQDGGGVAPEPWHLSYRPLAEPCAAALDTSVWLAGVQRTDLAFKDTLLEKSHLIFERYVQIP